MKRALLSVSDKTELVTFASSLQDLCYEILATTSTYEFLTQNKIKAVKISEFINQNELFNGRIKTMHPKILGGILYKRNNQSDLKQASENGISNIDLVCVNLYPFKEVSKKSKNLDEIIENIDIGGSTLLRSAAKNYKDVLVTCDFKDYESIICALKEKKDDEKFRFKLMIKAYEYSAKYDSYIANYFNDTFNDGFGEHKFIVARKVFDTKYGENPHQKGALYEFDDFFSSSFKTLKDKASFNNLLDINASLNLASIYKNSVAIIKHSNPCGYASCASLEESIDKAFLCDKLSSYGGVMAVNGVLTKDLALKISKHYIEVIIASRVQKEAIEVFKDKKRIKIFSQDKDFFDISKDKFTFKHINSGLLYQQNDILDLNEAKNATLKSKRKASEQELQDLDIALKIAAYTKSNSIVYVKDKILLAIGMGMTSRIDANKMAILKAKDMNIDLRGSVLASEAFFPFKDSIEEASKQGVSAIISPAGSIRDQEVIEAADFYGIALYFTNKRHFLH